MASPVEQIKEKLGIVDVVGSYLTLEKAGTNFKAKCPFHNEKTPSFFVSPARNSYYCFGCGAKGDIFNFVQQFEGLDFIGALRMLAKRAGIELEREKPGARTEREKLYLLVEHAVLFFQKQLGNNEPARAYLKKRGVIAETARSWRLGYAPLEWRALSAYLLSKGFKGEDIEKAGLAKKPEKTGSATRDVYDRFRGRIMFPIFDSSGRAVAFSGRQFESDGTEAKYINSPETPLFEKSKVLYGYDKAKLEIRKRDYSLLVEGQMDLIMSHQAGFTNAVASSGTALTADQLAILKRLSKNLVIAYDADPAGSAAAVRGWQIALALGLDVKIAVLAEGKDPADMAHDDKESFGAMIKNAKHIIDVELDRLMRTVKDERELVKQVEKKILPYVADIESILEQSHFIKKIAQTIGIKEDLLMQEVRKIEKKGLYIEDSTQKTQLLKSLSRREAMERMIFGIILWQERIPKQAINPLDIKTKLGSIIGEDELGKLDTQARSIKDELIFEAEISYSSGGNADESNSDLIRHADELLFTYEEEYMREQFAAAMRDLQRAERDKDTDKITTLLKRCQEISERLRIFNEKQVI